MTSKIEHVKEKLTLLPIYNKILYILHLCSRVEGKHFVFIALSNAEHARNAN